jgi:enoyl-CoA hydratase/carnithine racemase
MTARIFDGNAALKYGLVCRVTETPVEEALALAREIAERSPDCVAAAKQLFQTTWSVPDKDALEEETRLQRELLVPPLRNTVASTTKGMNLPIQMGFVERQPGWKGCPE